MGLFNRRTESDIYEDIGRRVAKSIKVYPVRFDKPPKSDGIEDYYEALINARTLNLAGKRADLRSLASLIKELVDLNRIPTKTFAGRA